MGNKVNYIQSINAINFINLIHLIHRKIKKTIKEKQNTEKQCGDSFQRIFMAAFYLY